MNQPFSGKSHGGYVVEAAWVPATFPSRLEATGVAEMCAQTVDGVYFESCAPLQTVLAAFAQAGLHVVRVRAAGTLPSWREGARSPAGAKARLQNTQAAVWLPTLPAA